MRKTAGLLLVCGCLWFAVSCGGGGGGTSTPTPPQPSVSAPGPVTGLKAAWNGTAIDVSWTAVTGATGYNVKRSTASGGPYTTVQSTSSTSWSDTSVTAGTAYYYVVSATNPAGEGSNSAEVAVAGSRNVTISVDTMANRHVINPWVYGVNFPPSTSYITQSGATLVRWGGNGSSRYNWKLFAQNAANDWYFQDLPFNALGSTNGADSVQFLKDVTGAGADPITTIPLLGWVAKSMNATDYSFSVQKYGAQCKVNPYLADDGDGLKPDCTTPITGNDPTDANVQLLDQPGTSDPPGTVYRNQWVAALAPAFGSSPHLYDMGNEPGIWNSTHRDVHPNPSTYDDLRDLFVTEAANVKQWDPKAVTMGPVSCCWEVYWNSAAGSSDKSAHGNIDFWPWWLNEVYWRGEITGTPLLDIFDFHAYPETSSTGLTTAQVDALALRSTRGWWDPTYTSETWIGGSTATSMQPLPHVEARLLRAEAMVHEVDPNMPISITEWNFGISATNNNTEDPIAQALTDADGWGLLGQYNVYDATRWEAPDPTTPSYQVMELYRNYDGNHSTFAPISVKATNDLGDAGLFSTYAAVDANGARLTLMVVNKMPATAAAATLSLSGFTPSQVTTYTVSAANPTIQASSATGFNGLMTFAPYSATLVVLTGTSTPPPVEWSLHPAVVMVPAGGSVVLHPQIDSGSGTVTLNGFQEGSGVSSSGPATTGISASITQPKVAVGAPGAITITAGNTPGFYSYTVTGQDSASGTETQSGWIEVGNPAATLTATGGGQSAAAGATIAVAVTVNPGSSGATPTGIPLLFSTSGGTLNGGTGGGTMQIVDTDSSGTATVQLTLPAQPGTVTVTATAPYMLGHATTTLTETAQ